MKLARLGDFGREKPALITDSAVYDLSGIIPDIDPASIANGAIARIRAAMEVGALPRLSGAADLRVGPPIHRPGAVICVGLNYAAHAAESGATPPASPVIFLKTPNTVGGPNDHVEVPRGSTKTDWEVELGVVIGKRALYLDSVADSADFIAGYVAANDLSERTFQLEISGGQWSKGKSAPGFSPLGPWLVTPDEVDATDLRLRSWVNGELRQDSNTSDLIFPVDFIIWHLSQFLALEPGDVILTGTPEGVALSGRFPYISAGDVVEIEIEGLGRQCQEFGQA